MALIGAQQAGGFSSLTSSLSARHERSNPDITWLPPGDSPNARKYRKSSQQALREGIARAEQEGRPIRVQVVIRATGLEGDPKQSRAIGCAITFNAANRFAVRYIRRRLEELAAELHGTIVLPADGAKPTKQTSKPVTTPAR